MENQMEMECISKQEYRLGFIQENMETVSYSLASFLIPLLIGHPQFLVGAIVNTALVLGALNLRSYRLLPVILLPSLGVLSRGIIFGPLTIYMVYMIPLIWAGNALLVYFIKRLYLEEKKGKLLTLGIAALIKSGFLFCSALALVWWGKVPAALLIVMGPMQLATAIAGSLAALGIQGLKKRHAVIAA